MGFAKVKEVQQTDIAHLEGEMNNLWGELNTSNVPHATRLEMEKKLTRCEEQFKEVLSGETSLKDLETNLRTCDKALALAVIKQAENELPKSERTSSSFQALENILHELNEGNVTPVRARHEVKGIMRHHTT